MSEVGLLVYGLVAFVMSVMSGATGGGGGFILTPIMIFLGLTPAQAIANGKFGSLAVTVGSLAGLRGHRVSSKKLVWVMVAMSIVLGLIIPRIIVTIESDTYQLVLGVLLMVLSPFIVYKKLGHHTKKVTSKNKAIGLVLIFGSMFLVGVFSGGLGIFMNIAMMGFLGMDALDASVTKRLSQLVLSSVIIAGLLTSGLFIANVIIVSLIANSLGGFVGGKVAIKKGSEFVSGLVSFAAFFSGLYLVIS